MNNWTIDGTDTGNLTNGLQTIDFKSVENLLGGSRNDNFRFKGWAQFSGAILGGDGTDVLDFSGSNRSVDVNFEQLRANSVASGLTNRISQIENVIGSRFSDTIVGDSGVNKIWGGDGNDQLYGGAGADYLYGGDGDDELYGQSGVDTLYGQADNDLLDGGWDSAVDQLYGGTGVDTFIEDNPRLGDFYKFYEERVRDATGEDIRRRRVFSKVHLGFHRKCFPNWHDPILARVLVCMKGLWQEWHKLMHASPIRVSSRRVFFVASMLRQSGRD